MKRLILRDEYLNFLISHVNKPIIKVISGIRGCGISTLLEFFRNYLEKSGINSSQIVVIDFEDIKNIDLRNYQALEEYVRSKFIEEKMIYVFLDEIQHCKYFEKAIDSLFKNKNVDIYLMGSNAYFMSGELAILLSGRYAELKMLPLSFKEYCDSTDRNLPLRKKFNNYIVESSFPYNLVHEINKNQKRDYLDALYCSLLLKNVIEKKKTSDVLQLESVILYLAKNLGKLLTPSLIAKSVTASGKKIDIKTVQKYLTALKESLIIYECRRFDLKGKQLLKLQVKYYFADVAFCYLLVNAKNLDIGCVLENVVYLELIRRGYQVYIGQNDNSKVDFIAENENETLYFQVSASVRDSHTLKREIFALKNINDRYPKYILTLDEDPDADYDGIKKIKALEWLINK